MQQLFYYTFWNNSVKDWTIAFGLTALLFIIIGLSKKLVLKRLVKWAAATDNSIDDFLVEQAERVATPFLRLLAVYCSLSMLEFSTTADTWIKRAMLLVAVYLSLKLITATTRFIIQRSLRDQANIEVKTKQARGIILIINFVIWIAGIIFFVNNIGYNVTSIIAGLGIGGIAIALAAQAILGDLFSYFVIFFDKPFEIGDFITVDDKAGLIEYIGLKTTRIRTLSGEQLVFSNQDLTNSRLHNFKRMEKRRVVFSIGVVYSTPPEKLKTIPGIIRNCIERMPDTVFDRSHFAAFGDFSLNFETVYFVTSADYNMFRDRQQELNFSLLTTFEKEGIDFAFPTQTILMPQYGTNATFDFDKPLKQQP